jgi:hypothetical protein
MKRGSRKFFISIGSIVTISSIFTIAIGGIISNRSDALFVNLANLLFALINNNSPWGIIACILLVGFLISTFLAWQHISILHSQLKRANSIIK